MFLTLSLKDAPTDNRRLIFAPYLKRFVSSPEYRLWKTLGVLAIKSQVAGKEPIQGSFEAQVPYHVKVWMKDKRTDQVNWDKGARDILTEAGVWDDDKWMYPIYEACGIDKENPRMEITIYENT